jgi:peptidoglycan/LPS O-acetylase OafA/YrhL
MLRSIALLRGFSALFVLVFHSVYFSGLTLRGTAHFLEPIAGRLSLCGITTFFCLSGYLMARLVETESFGRFASRRILRIYPAFLGAVLITFVANRLGAVSLPDFPWRALTLLPVGTVVRPLGVEWTLVYEVFYYAVASLFCFGNLRRLFPAFVAAWAVVVLVAFFGFNMLGSNFAPSIREIAFSAWNLGFLLGALGRYAERKGWTRPWWVFPGLALLAVSEVWGLGLRVLVLPAGLSLIVMAAIRWETSRDGFAAPDWALKLGDASFGIYLLHVTIIRSVVARFGPESNLPILLLTLLSAVIAVMLSMPFGLFEHRFYRQLTRWASTRTSTPQDVQPTPGAARTGNPSG